MLNVIIVTIVHLRLNQLELHVYYHSAVNKTFPRHLSWFSA